MSRGLMFFVACLTCMSLLAAFQYAALLSTRYSDMNNCPATIDELNDIYSRIWKPIESLGYTDSLIDAYNRQLTAASIAFTQGQYEYFNKIDLSQDDAVAIGSMQLSASLRVLDVPTWPAYVPVVTLSDPASLWVNSITPKTAPFNLSLCAFMKAEAYRVNEFVIRNYLFGFEHFYIYHDTSRPYATENRELFEQQLQPLVESGLVTVIPWPKGGQLGAMQHCTGTSAAMDRFNALLDADEFFTWRKRPADVNAYFTEHFDKPGIGGVVASWMIFGYNQHIHAPQGSYTSQYRLVCRPDKHIKTIVRPSTVKYNPNPHFADFKPGFTAVRQETFTPHMGPWMPWSPFDDFFVSHHLSTSLEGFLFKRMTNGGMPLVAYNLKHWLGHTTSCLNTECPYTARLAAEVERLMATVSIPPLTMKWTPQKDDSPEILFLTDMIQNQKRTWNRQLYLLHLLDTQQIDPVSGLGRDQDAFLKYVAALAEPNSPLLGDTKFWSA